MYPTIDQLNRQLEDIINKYVDRIVNEVMREQKKYLPQLQSEIYGYFKTVAEPEILRKFIETYGSNFDVQSLYKSITYDIDANLHPSISYNKSVFLFTSEFENDIDDFNQSASREDFRSIMDSSEFITLEEDGAFINGDSAFDVIYDEIGGNKYDNRPSIFSPINRMHREGGFSKLESTYDAAIHDALTKFEYEYTKSIEPRLRQKYSRHGINI